MQASEINGGYEFYNLPKGMDATLIGLQFKGGKIFVGIQNVITGNEVDGFIYSEVTKERLKEIIDELSL